MSFFDQLAGGLNKVTKDLTNKAQEISDTAKLNSKINDANALVKSTYTAIGEACFARYGSDEENEFAEEFRIIREAKASIEEYRNEINRIKGVTVCQSCGGEISKDASFCPKCGARVERPVQEEPVQEEPKTEKKTCSVCHAELEEDAQFCVNCGAPVDNEENTED